ncbi:hypothetical protein PR048_026127 [Dryococelus australis]|uniref:Uncharacterized protein n=1 Tax=Dryococelus australis TaxID=614101 RepID=A0ABQ9GKF9_9NEOP|nr:hypothetical protein PR048_026127 [Dryococelus australis]
MQRACGIVPTTHRLPARRLDHEFNSTSRKGGCLMTNTYVTLSLNDFAYLLKSLAPSYAALDWGILRQRQPPSSRKPTPSDVTDTGWHPPRGREFTIFFYVRVAVRLGAPQYLFLFKTLFTQAVRLLASYQCELDSVPCRFTPDFRKWESCRTMPLVGGFSQGSSVSPPALSFRRSSTLTSFTLIGSRDLVVKCRPNLFTLHSLRLHTPARWRHYTEKKVLLNRTRFFWYNQIICYRVNEVFRC